MFVVESQPYESFDPNGTARRCSGRTWGHVVQARGNARPRNGSTRQCTADCRCVDGEESHSARPSTARGHGAAMRSSATSDVAGQRGMNAWSSHRPQDAWRPQRVLFQEKSCARCRTPRDNMRTSSPKEALFITNRATRSRCQRAQTVSRQAEQRCKRYGICREVTYGRRVISSQRVCGDTGRVRCVLRNATYAKRSASPVAVQRGVLCVRDPQYVHGGCLRRTQMRWCYS